MLFGSVHDGSHTLLNRPVLRIDAIDAREGLRLLSLSVYHPVVAGVGEAAERRWVHMSRAIAQLLLAALVVGQGLSELYALARRN